MSGENDFGNWAVYSSPQYAAAKTDMDVPQCRCCKCDATLLGHQRTSMGGISWKSRMHCMVIEGCRGKLIRCRSCESNLLTFYRLNMPISRSTPARNAEIQGLMQEGKSLPTPQTQFYAPTYSVQNYADMVREGINNARGSNPTYREARTNFDKGKQVNKADFGQTSLSTNSSFPVPWFSFSAGDTESHVLSSDDQQRTEVVVKWTNKTLSPITTGNW